MTTAPSKNRRRVDKARAEPGEHPAVTGTLVQLDPDSVVVSPDRLRQLDEGAVQAMVRAFELAGQLQPIRVERDEAGQDHLIFGLRRLFAAKQLGRAVDAIVVPASTQTGKQRRLSEIFENIIRSDYNALERAIALRQLKQIHEALYPQARNGGDRRSAAAKAERDQNEIFSFSSLAAERTGLSARAIEISVAIANGLTPDIQARLAGTWLANHQAGLSLLAQQTPAMQDKLLGIVFAPVETRQAETIAEALVLAQGKTLPRPSDKHWQALTNKMARSSRDQRLQLFTLYEDEIIAFVKSRGLV